MEPESAQMLERLAVALAIGLLMGLERGWEYRQLPEGGRVAGIRTFGLIALLGAIAVQIGGMRSDLLLAGAILSVAMLMGIGFWRDTAHSEDVSITTSIAALVAFGLGAMAGLGHLTIASSAAVVVTLILGFRIELHSLVAHIEREELTATLRLLLITVVMLPILPDRPLGPWQAFNPYQIWWMVVVIALLSYVGYFANKFLGTRRGMIVTGLVGGMTSSTAVALTLAPVAKEQPDEREVVSAAVLAASAIMFPRMLIIAAIVMPQLALQVAPGFVVAVLIAGGAAGWLAWRSRDAAIKEPREMHTNNPLDLWFAVKFGLLLTVIMVVSRAAETMIGNRGLAAVAAIAGLADVDAITLSASSMVKQGQAQVEVGAIAVMIAAAVNTLVKPALMTSIAGLNASVRVWIALLLAIAGGAAAALIWR